MGSRMILVIGLVVLVLCRDADANAVRKEWMRSRAQTHLKCGESF